MKWNKSIAQIAFALIVMTFAACQSREKSLLLKKHAHISLVGNNLGARMINYDHFETQLQLRYPDSMLYVRNMCDAGNTPGFRPHSGRPKPWAFPGAEKFQTELATNTGSIGFYEYPDEWLRRHKTDIIIAFFGFNESFQGSEKLENYKAELDAFIKHTIAQKYNDDTIQLAIVSPISFEDLSDQIDVPDGKLENQNLELYTKAMKEVAEKNNVLFIDVFHPSADWYVKSSSALTIDGYQLNNEGYQKLGLYLADKLFGKMEPDQKNRELVYDAVQEKNWMWHNDYKIPNGVHVYGRRYDPFGPANYPYELKKIREMTDIRDQAIWSAASKGEKINLEEADRKTDTLPQVKTNYNPAENGSLAYLSGKQATEKLNVPAGYKIELFASEAEFPDLAKPVQMSFDNKGRLWVACMPSYPHYKPGDKKPNDKLIILEDTDADGKADKQTVFADKLHLPIGFEITAEGVYVSQSDNLVILKDTNNDDRADIREILLSGFDDHDTHHAIHAFTTDPSGAIYMGEGVFLHTDVETSYGPVRGTNGGFYRYNPTRHHLERTAQLEIPNPWGIAFDNWGQYFFSETSGPDNRWMMPGSVLPRYGESTHKSFNLIEEAHKVRPTSGLEFISSSHFPDEVQGDLILCNNIGFLGIKEHILEDSGTGYESRHRQDLLVSNDKNFRPVDLEFAPDGSLYLIDWHNVLIGHMQHNARDPLRDHTHGRVYRITYPQRPLVKPAKIAGASVEQLLDNLKLPEYRTRYRTRTELRGRNKEEVLSKVKTWINRLDKKEPRYEHHLLEALWVSWGQNKIDQDLLKQLLKADDYHVRAAAVQAVRYNGHQLANQTELLINAAQDEHGRVRLAALVAASWTGQEKGMQVLNEVKKKPLDEWMIHAFEAAESHLNDRPVQKPKDIETSTLKGEALSEYDKGKEIYLRDGYCGTCHQPDGKGLTASEFPPLANSEWVNGSEQRLIKLVLKGIMGPLEVDGKKYSGQVPMTPFGGLLNDEEIAAVLSYVRSSFGNKGAPIQAETVKKARASIVDKKDFYTGESLLRQHPWSEDKQK